MEFFLSCDWGTSSLRLRLIDAEKKQALAEVSTDEGIAQCYERWKQSGIQDKERIIFYQSVLEKRVVDLQHKTNLSLQYIPIIVSGMASSNIGMIELPYKEIPFTCDGSDLLTKTIDATKEFAHGMIIVSGVKTKNDVMRGEEVQLIGCLQNARNNGEQVIIFPGTHSKHINVEDGRAVDFKTYMTGELFELLAKKSTLSNVIEETNVMDENNLWQFKKAVNDSQTSNLLHNAFLIRTNYLLNGLSKKENYYFLSGLIIGAEIKELVSAPIPVTIVANESLSKLYSVAFNQLNIPQPDCIDVSTAVINGHCKIYNRYQHSGDSLGAEV